MNAISEKSRVVLRDAQFRPEREGGLGGDRAGVPQGRITGTIETGELSDTSLVTIGCEL